MTKEKQTIISIGEKKLNKKGISNMPNESIDCSVYKYMNKNADVVYQQLSIRRNRNSITV